MAMELRGGARRRLFITACFCSPLGLALAQGLDARAAGGVTVLERHMDVGPRKGRATNAPRREADQKLLNKWPLYRTKRGQEAFNAAMATLAATDVAPPSARAFRGCEDLTCSLDLPKVDARGWLPAGRLWTAPDKYILIVHSPRPSRSKPRRRSKRSMRIFVFHEFHNSTRNTDVFDTISAHKFSVFTPFYIGKEGRDARGRKYVTLVQVAPYDVVSRHASNLGNRGPGVEVAKNKWEPLTPLQRDAGVLLAVMSKQAAPQLKVVHHRYKEGLPMLKAYRARAAAVRKRLAEGARKLPFTPAKKARLASVRAPLNTLIKRKGLQPARRLAALPGAKQPKRAAAPKRVVTYVAPKIAVPAPARALRANLASIASASAIPSPRLATRPVTPPLATPGQTGRSGFTRASETGAPATTAPTYSLGAAEAVEPSEGTTQAATAEAVNSGPAAGTPAPEGALTMNGLFKLLFGQP
ncbi:MAG: hypothetical protein AAFQ42_09280 [Pseudomonadota bacterium]